MTSTPAAERVHRILGFTRALGAALDRVLVHDPVVLSAEEKQACWSTWPGSRPGWRLWS